MDVHFEHVVTVGSAEQPLTTEYVPLVDGSELGYEPFKQAVEFVQEYLRREEPTLVHCEVGISRSAAVIATALACEEGMAFEEALTEVKQYRPQASPRRPLRQAAARYLKETHSPVFLA